MRIAFNCVKRKNQSPRSENGKKGEKTSFARETESSELMETKRVNQRGPTSLIPMKFPKEAEKEKNSLFPSLD
jgi:hypothetical protein